MNRLAAGWTISMLVAATLPAGCSKQSGSGGGAATSTAPVAGELTVLCGSSFVKPADALIERFKAETGIAVVTTSAGSEDFLPLVKAAQKGDILITHDPYLDYVREANALGDHCHVGSLAPVLAVRKGNPKGLKSVEDLTRPGLKVALSDPQYSTCGEMVKKYLQKKGWYDAVMANVENRLTKGHSDLGTFLKTQTVDAVIMWNGVANTFKDSVDVVPTPYEYDDEIRVHIMGMSYSKVPDATGRFVEFARKQGPEIFAEYGYVR